MNPLATPSVWHPPATPDAPVLVLLHGTGADEHDLVPLGRSLDADAGLLGLRGWVTEGGLPRFFRRVPDRSADANPAYPYTFDHDDVIAQVGRLAEIVERAGQVFEFGERPVLAVGFSNGANLAAASLLLQPELFRAAVLLAPMPVLDSPGSADLSSVAALLGAGRRDPIATPAHVETLAGWLADRGAAVQVRFHDGGHELRPPVVQAAADWLAKLRMGLGADRGGIP